ncbi:MAG: succinyl-diaminopimelate desuccinylase [Propionibacteriaceae bacterium]|nr:succinyl-diaminopimelate desuccinylase [Propionibacteriaceae bacterium]
MLNLAGDIRVLLRDVVDIESVSGNEAKLADEVFDALNVCSHLHVTRVGNLIVAQTHLGCSQRVAIAGHLDTVPVAGNLPSRVQAIDGREALVGRGTCDMKGGVAVQLNLAATLTNPTRDITWIFYDCEEVEASRNGLGRLAEVHPELLKADMAILMEPTDGVVEAGCQGTLRVTISTTGTAAHSARSWLGHNAIHEMVGALQILQDYEPAQVDVDGLTYREGLNAVGISGGIAGNVIPDLCELSVNYRFAPDKDESQAIQVVREVFAGYPIVVADSAPGAIPGLRTPAVASFVEAMGSVRPKYGWTDVSRFSGLSIPAVNYGPGDPNLAHTDGEYVFLDSVESCRDSLHNWLIS